MKGVLEQRPSPQNVQSRTSNNFSKSWAPNDSLTFKHLTFQLAMLLALLTGKDVRHVTNLTLTL